MTSVVEMNLGLVSIHKALKKYYNKGSVELCYFCQIKIWIVKAAGSCHMAMETTDLGQKSER